MSLPTIILPGYFASAKEYQALEDLLQAKEITAITVPLTTWDWVPSLGGRSMQSILAKIDDTVQRLITLRTPRLPVIQVSGMDRPPS